ncbi:hypothetical protein H0H93_007456, partial [Arthromyces matolae]
PCGLSLTRSLEKSFVALLRSLVIPLRFLLNMSTTSITRSQSSFQNSLMERSLLLRTKMASSSLRVSPSPAT